MKTILFIDWENFKKKLETVFQKEKVEKPKWNEYNFLVDELRSSSPFANARAVNEFLTVLFIFKELLYNEIDGFGYFEAKYYLSLA